MSIVMTLQDATDRSAPAKRSAVPVASLLLAIATAFNSTHAPAQSCAAPIALIAGNTYMGSTCEGTHVADTFCGGLANPGPNTVFRFAVGPPLAGQLTLVAQSAEFTPVMYLMDGAQPCDSAPCVAVGDTFTPIPFDGLAPGEYWLVIAAAPSATPGSCGEFSLSNDASPVESILANGFE
jgi:hypothetical protein